MAKHYRMPVLIASIAGTAFALTVYGWMNNGAEILFALIESGLAWCF